VLEGGGEAEPHDGETLLLAAARRQQHPLRRQRLGEHLRERERLGDVQCRLDPLGRQVVLAGEEHEPAELGGERGEIVVRLLEREELERAVHDLQPLLEPAAVPHDLREPGGHACSRVGRSRALEERDRLLVMRGCLVRARAGTGHQARVLVQVRLLEGVVRQLDGTFIRVLRLLARGERGRALPCAGEHLPRGGPDLGRVGILRLGAICVDVVRGEHLDGLVVVTQRPEVLRRAEVQGLSLPPRKRVVGDLLHEILEEAVLPALG
jgi:hypothetical protein